MPTKTCPTHGGMTERSNSDFMAFTPAIRRLQKGVSASVIVDCERLVFVFSDFQTPKNEGQGNPLLRYLGPWI